MSGLILNVKPYLKKSIGVKHRPLFASRDRYCVAYGGAGSGKSHAIAEKILWRVVNNSSCHRILIVRKVAATIKKSVWALILLKLNRWGILQFCKINISEKTIFFNGNYLFFMGLDDPEKLKSIEGITSIWCEEASDITENDFDQLDLRLRGATKTYKQIILSFNPIHVDHWLKKRFFDREQKGTFISHTSYLDNIHIDDDYKKVFDRLKKTNRIYYNIYALGHWGVYKGIIFDNWVEIDRVPRAPAGDWDFVGNGIDFGFNVASSVVRCYIKGNILILDELVYQTHLTNNELIELLKLTKSDKAAIYWADSAEPDRIKEINNAGFKCYGANKASVLDRINFCKNYEIQVTARSDNLKKELNTYVWREDRNGNQLDQPLKVNDHAIDAFAYCVYTRFLPAKKISEINQGMLGF